jgi:5-methylcytosine-specific restriction endonuclease McrA
MSLTSSQESVASPSDSSASACEPLPSASATSSANPSCASTGQASLFSTMSRQWRLTEAQKQEATAYYEAGESLGSVAKRYRVSRQSLWDVLRRRTKLRDRIQALPRKDQTAIRKKRLATLRRYRSRAARITRGQIRAVRERDKTCRMCGSQGKDIDHIVPISKGGQTEMNNLQLLCHPCHIQKSRLDRKEG